jgi:aquaporin Z
MLGVPCRVLLAEFAATAGLVLLGLSAVIVDFGSGGPVASTLPDAGLRRAITGFVFGSIGALIAISPLGRESGAHLNPAVTFAFRLRGAVTTRTTVAYVLTQCAGAVIGAAPLLAWGAVGRSVAYGATLPGPGYPTWAVLGGETLSTAALVVGLLVMLGHRRSRAYTPLLFPVLYAVLVFAEAPLSGASTNPARSLGPAVVSGRWDGWWIYWLGPLLGTLIGVAVCRLSPLRTLELEVAKIAHHDHDPHGLFHRLNPGVDRSPVTRSTP